MFSYAFFMTVIMETHREQRTVIKFCFKNELTAAEMFKTLQKVYSNECLSRTNIFEWCGKFHNGWESMDDNPRAGCHRASWTPEHIAKVRAALADDKCSMIRMLAEWFHIDEEIIRKIIKEDFGGGGIVCAICTPWTDVRTIGRSRNFLLQFPSNAQKKIRNFWIKLSQATNHGVSLTTRKVDARVWLGSVLGHPRQRNFTSKSCASKPS